MTSLTGEEPDLQLGDSGEWVVQLQVRLYGLRLLREVPDQSFGSTTEQAVRELQNQVGHSATGEVNRDTWEALVYAENQVNIQYRYTSPYDALDQLVYDLQHGVQRDGSGNVIQEGSSDYAGQLSDDGQYRWDGYHWQPVADAQQGAYTSLGQVSDDGQYRWDGTDWHAVSDDAGLGGADSYAGQLSDDGQYRWDGNSWQPAQGGGQDYVGQLSDDGLWRWDGFQWQAA
jgi:peptidoglycan hydrolase-like protein with peptidoglycan-binding domain